MSTLSRPVRWDGGPAYPQEDRGWGSDEGMSLRDWFAGQALAGMCSNLYGPEPSVFAKVATEAYAIADAMLKAREARS